MTHVTKTQLVTTEWNCLFVLVILALVMMGSAVPVRYVKPIKQTFHTQPPY